MEADGARRVGVRGVELAARVYPVVGNGGEKRGWPEVRTTARVTGFSGESLGGGEGRIECHEQRTPEAAPLVPDRRAGTGGLSPLGAGRRYDMRADPQGAGPLDPTSNPTLACPNCVKS